jgi:hypothetical protein
MSESGARYRRILACGASRRPRAFSFIARSASMVPRGLDSLV